MNDLPEEKKPDSLPEEKTHPLARPFLWTLTPCARKAALPVLGVLMLVLVGAEIVYPFKGHTPLSGVKGFYALFGFIGFGLIVLSGWPLRVLLSRKPDYYGDDDGA